MEWLRSVGERDRCRWTYRTGPPGTLHQGVEGFLEGSRREYHGYGFQHETIFVQGSVGHPAAYTYTGDMFLLQGSDAPADRRLSPKAALLSSGARGTPFRYSLELGALANERESCPRTFVCSPAAMSCLSADRVYRSCRVFLKPHAQAIPPGRNFSTVVAHCGRDPFRLSLFPWVRRLWPLPSCLCRLGSSALGHAAFLCQSRTFWLGVIFRLGDEPGRFLLVGHLLRSFAGAGWAIARSAPQALPVPGRDLCFGALHRSSGGATLGFLQPSAWIAFPAMGSRILRSSRTIMA